MDGFKVPHIIPQDLLLIHELVGIPYPEPAPAKSDVKPEITEDDDINSSDDDDVASEEEIAADLITGAIDEDDVNIKSEEKPLNLSAPSESTSESDADSDSDSDTSEEEKGAKPKMDQDLDDDEDPVPAATSGTYFQTKHELPEVEVPIPDFDQVGSDELLESVGEVVTIVDRLAIVRGLPSDRVNRGSDRALDSDTLLVFDDRKVMGYIYETFGPTSQPHYQVKFSTAFPLNTERVRIGREVFHVPQRSHFVFVNQIKVFKGSDASNVHDEEPADEELEFSDDEAEAAYRSRLKRKRGESRARSVASSRHSTPNPTLMRDQELADDGFYSRNAYDEHGPYDIDYSSNAPRPSSSSTHSRPAPIPYDDPYGEEYTNPNVDVAGGDEEVPVDGGADAPDSREFHGSRDGRRDRGRGHDRSEGQFHGRGSGRDRDRGRGRGRDRDRRERGRGRGGGGEGRDGGGGGRAHQRYNSSSEKPTESPRDVRRSSMSPTSLAIARATGQLGYPEQSQHQNHHPHQLQQQTQQQNSAFPGRGGYPESNSSWGYGQMPMSPMHAQFQQQYAYGMQQHQPPGYQGFMPTGPGAGSGAATFVQPHINPRFASAFAMGMVPGIQGQPSYGSFEAVAQTHMNQQYSHSQTGSVGVGSGAISSPAAPAPSWTDEWAVPVEHFSSTDVGSSSPKNTAQ